jgi:hypothetical protein
VDHAIPAQGPTAPYGRARLGCDGRAACAWVFWLEVASPRTDEVRHGQCQHGGTREACEQALTPKLASDSEKDTSVEVTVDRLAGRPRLWVRRKGHPEPLAAYSYVCFPDTVDPRVSKSTR